MPRVPAFPRTAVLLSAAALGLVLGLGPAGADSTVPLSWGDSIRISGEAWGCSEPSNLAGITLVACASRNHPFVRFSGSEISVIATHAPRVSRTPGPAPRYTYTFEITQPAQAPLFRYEGRLLTPGKRLVFPDFPSLSCSFDYEPRAFMCFVHAPSQACSLDDDPLTCLTVADVVVSVVGARTLQVSIDRPARSERLDSGVTSYHWNRRAGSSTAG
jgi:hypothetical protein